MSLSGLGRGLSYIMIAVIYKQLKQISSLQDWQRRGLAGYRFMFTQLQAKAAKNPSMKRSCLDRQGEWRLGRASILHRVHTRISNSHPASGQVFVCFCLFLLILN
jgi:hypothetical protein